MNLVALAGPAVEPITLAEARSYLRLDGTDEDDLVGVLIKAARLTVERTTRLSLIAQGWRVRLGSWPPDRAIAIPVGPLLSVDAVRVAVSAGSTTTLTPDLYRLDDTAEPARLLIDASAPDPASAATGISVDVTAGFGASSVAVPEPLRLAVRRLVAHWFESRGDGPGSSPGPLPAEVSALLAPFARPRLA